MVSLLYNTAQSRFIFVHAAQNADYFKITSPPGACASLSEGVCYIHVRVDEVL